jgi:hypothetical protein
LLVQHLLRANRNGRQIGEQAAEVLVRHRREQAVLGSPVDRQRAEDRRRPEAMEKGGS